LWWGELREIVGGGGFLAMGQAEHCLALFFAIVLNVFYNMMLLAWVLDAA